MSTDPYRGAATRAARRHGIPRQLFTRLVNQESGWQPQVVSSSGAVGLTQLMPATAASLKVNPRDPVANLEGGARYLREQYDRFGSWKLALAAYNAGPGAVEQYGGVPPYEQTRSYVKNIMSSYKSATTPAAVMQPEQTGSAKKRSTQPQPVPITPVTLPSGGIFGNDTLAQAAFDSLGKIARGYKPTSALTEMLQTPNLFSPAASSSFMYKPPAPEQTGAAPAPAAPGVPRRRRRNAPVDPSKWVVMAPGADRSGVPTKQAVKGFVAKVAQSYGKPLEIGTGSDHNQYVAGTDRQSQHWTGDAADIPMAGDALTKLGQTALIAAGADPEWARRQQGGAFNIGGYNILFNTHIGGNHYNHLHVGV